MNEPYYACKHEEKKAMHLDATEAVRQVEIPVGLPYWLPAKKYLRDIMPGLSLVIRFRLKFTDINIYR